MQSHKETRNEKQNMEADQMLRKITFPFAFCTTVRVKNIMLQFLSNANY